MTRVALPAFILLAAACAEPEPETSAGQAGGAPREAAQDTSARDAGAGSGSDTAGDRDPDAEPVTVAGTAQTGPACPELATPDGEIYGLSRSAGEDGVFVEVTGAPTDALSCGSVDQSLEVQDVSDIPAPQNALPANATRPERAYLEGPWAVKGGNCERPNFDISPVPGAERLSVETSLDGAPRTGEVRSGDGAALVFDQPRRVFPVEKRNPDALAVLPAQSGTVTLGGEAIEGDGVVFIRCAE